MHIPMDIQIESHRTGRTSVLSKILPPIKRDIVATVHVHGSDQAVHTELVSNTIVQVVQGFQLSFTQTPTQITIPPELQLPADQIDLITREVEELKHKGAISPALQAPGSFVSQLFLVPKKDGGTQLFLIAIHPDYHR